MEPRSTLLAVTDERRRHDLPGPQWPTADAARAAQLFSPLAQGRLRLTTRTWVPAMVPWRATENGEVTPELLAWYGRFAAGQPGALVVEATGIRDVPSGPLLRIGHDRFIPGLTSLVAEVDARSQGQTALFIQLIDFLAVKRRPVPEVFLRRFLTLTPEHRDRLAALDSEVWRTASDLEVRAHLATLDEATLAQVLSPRELEDLRYGYRERITDPLPHVRALPQTLPPLFAAAARRAQTAGFHGVELHYAHAYTMASFLSRTNDRQDGYGGSPEARLRLAVEVFRAVRSAVGSKFVVGCRILADEAIVGGSGLEDTRYYATELARAGLDFISLSKGGKFDDAKQPKVGQAVYPYTGPSGHECMPTVWSDARGPHGRNLPLAYEIRSAVRAAGFATPIVAAGALNTFALAEGALQSGACDVVASARQSLADPDWFLKMRLGHGDQIRRCALTNYCEGLDQQHKAVTCRLWDRAPGPLRTADGKRLLVAPPWQG